ncbi:MAG: S41 family peptidase [Deltaproteobacteria bacterium]|nr:S41 family peptidase [Deltaproteobacteria bacterium]
MKIPKKILFIVLGFFLGVLVSAHALSDKIYQELEVFTRIIEIIDKEYVEPIDEHEMVNGAIQGMLSSLDPHTVYLSPDMYRDFKSDTTGQFGGVGIEITVKDGILTVVSPVEGAPAYKAGIKSGDKILKINGEATKGMSLVDAVHKMRGPSGKKVVLTVWRDQKSMDFTIVREIIKMDAVKSDLPESGIGYARIVSFQEKTGEMLKKHLKELEDKNGGSLKGLVLDLRDNPGGLLTEAVKVSDLFMEKGTIVSTRGRNKEVELKEARNNSPYEKIPVIVLVNRGSASASEIVAGALQDTKRAKILGTTSFGKGSVQSLVDLGDKSALKLTIAKYYTPKGRSIEGKGIEPDIKIDSAEYKKAYPKKAEGQPTLEEFQKQKALEYLSK